MNRLVSHFVALLLAGHMLLGCCRHHAHACTAVCVQDCSECSSHAHHGEPADSRSCEHRQSCHQEPGDGQPTHHPTDLCSGERCSFVAGPKAVHLEPLLAIPAIVQDSLASGEDLSLTGRFAGHCCWRPPLPHASLHALNCLLQI